MSFFATKNLKKKYGGLVAVDNVSWEINEGDVAGLIGPNGSGKTTLLNIMSGFVESDEGSVWLEGKNVTRLKPAQLAHHGLLRMFQMTRVFPRMTCVDNLLTVGLAMGLTEKEAGLRSVALLDELTLSHVAYLDAGQLSGGQRKLLEFGACFIKPPRIALLDEPFAAVHPVMRATMADFIRRRNRDGQTFIVVSHDMPIIMDLCPTSLCMSAGKVIAQGSTRSVLSSTPVMEAYLGNTETAEASDV